MVASKRWRPATPAVPWPPEDDTLMMTMRAVEATWEEVGLKVGRSPWSCQVRMDWIQRVLTKDHDHVASTMAIGGFPSARHLTIEGQPVVVWIGPDGSPWRRKEKPE